MANKISKKMTFEEILNKHPEVAEILLDKGMHCIGCPCASAETLEQGAIMHGIDPNKLIEEIKKSSKKKK